MKQSDMLDNSVQVRDTLTITTSQKYEACTRQTLGLQRQTTSCSDATGPRLVAYDLNTGSPTDSCTDTNTPLKHILSTHLLFMYRIKRQTVSQSGERHFVCHDWMCSNIDKKSLGCKKPVGRTLLPTTGWGKRQVPRRPAWSWSVYQAIVRVAEKLLAWCKKSEASYFFGGGSQSFFCTFSWFFWIFWWTTFNVVRKFPRNRTRNVNASINTWKKKKRSLITRQVATGILISVAFVCFEMLKLGCEINEGENILWKNTKDFKEKLKLCSGRDPHLPLLTVLMSCQTKQCHRVVQLPKLRRKTKCSRSRHGTLAQAFFTLIHIFPHRQ